MHGLERRTYLRVGGDVFPVFGDDVRGFSPFADDFFGLVASSPYVYASIEEMFFVLVNLRIAAVGEC
jgi:hypothetical protein